MTTYKCERAKVLADQLGLPMNVSEVTHEDRGRIIWAFINNEMAIANPLHQLEGIADSNQWLDSLINRVVNGYPDPLAHDQEKQMKTWQNSVSQLTEIAANLESCAKRIRGALHFAGQ